MPAPHALITGASIAGPAVAWWLNRAGWRTTVVERAPELRTGGQNIDIRAQAREVIERMGLTGAVRDHRTGEVGTEFIGPDGRPVARFPVSDSDRDGPTAELEIVRGDLAGLLVDAVGDGTEFRFGDHVDSLEQDRGGVNVRFASGAEGRYDVVIVAEGVRSRTRDLVFGDAVDLRPVGLSMAWATITRDRADTDWWEWYQAPGRRSVTLRPDNHGTIRVTLSFVNDLPGLERLGDEAQIELTRAVFEGLGWKVPRVLAQLGERDWYFETLTQVRVPRWSSGRVVLVGDAAWAPTPISGMGTSLALIGAYVLAGELGRHDPWVALARYEQVLRDRVERGQKLPPGGPRTLHPDTRVGIAVTQGLLRLAASAPAHRLGDLGTRLLGREDDRFRLPDYDAGAPTHLAEAAD